MAREMIVAARQVAVVHERPKIRTEHFLLVLIDHTNTAASLSLKSLNIDVAQLRAATADACQKDAEKPDSEGVFTASSKRAIELAFESARKLKHDSIGTGHLLIGLLGSTDGEASRLLTACGINHSQLLEEVARLDKLERREKSGLREKLSTHFNKLWNLIKDF
jgi:ATP-dependent Clp protease ATP-binding subunit ClpA